MRSFCNIISLHIISLSYVPLLQILQSLYKLKFRVISHEVNMVMGPGKDSFYNFVEVVFMKDNLWY